MFGAAERCGQLTDAICAHDEACLERDPLADQVCRSIQACTNPTLQAEEDAEVDAGRVVVDLAQFQACLTDIRNGDCALLGSQVQQISTHCLSFSIGNVSAGGACLFGTECVSGYTCVRQADTCGGTCVARATSGACDPSGPPLATGYFCDTDAGQVRAQGGQDSPCSADGDCRLGFVCRYDASGTGSRTCQQHGLATDGGPCFLIRDCANGYGCLGTTNDGGADGGPGPGACVALSPAGNTCLLGLPDGGHRINSSLCYSNDFCDRDAGLCEAQPVLGQACNADGGNPKCVTGSCQDPGDGGAPACILVPDGQPCRNTRDCQSGSCVGLDGGSASVCAASCP